jgi:hypothetical protein
VQEALEREEKINLPEWASEVAESLADMIVIGCPKEQHATLIAFTFEELARFIRDKKDLNDETEAGPSNN